MHSKGQMDGSYQIKTMIGLVIFKHQIFTHFSCLSNHRLTSDFRIFFRKLSLDHKFKVWSGKAQKHNLNGNA